ncbi:restriction endonuclease, SacI family [Pseudoroseomonas wenyumeiae]
MDARVAEAILRQAASADGPADGAWEAKVERLSQLCEDGTSKTHIAFLGTSILATAVDARADLRAIKPKLAPGNPHAYSARSLCHGVLVPLSAELGFSLGVSGREPLNNQPYFRMTRLGDDTPVHTGGRAAFDFMVGLVDDIQRLDSSGAREALRAFVTVRRRYQRSYGTAGAAAAITPAALITAVRRLVSVDSRAGAGRRPPRLGCSTSLPGRAVSRAAASTTRPGTTRATSPCSLGRPPKEWPRSTKRRSRSATSRGAFPTSPCSVGPVWIGGPRSCDGARVGCPAADRR